MWDKYGVLLKLSYQGGTSVSFPHLKKKTFQMIKKNSVCYKGPVSPSTLNVPKIWKAFMSLEHAIRTIILSKSSWHSFDTIWPAVIVQWKNVFPKCCSVEDHSMSENSTLLSLSYKDRMMFNPVTIHIEI